MPDSSLVSLVKAITVDPKGVEDKYPLDSWPDDLNAKVTKTVFDKNRRPPPALPLRKYGAVKPFSNIEKLVKATMI